MKDCEAAKGSKGVLEGRSLSTQATITTSEQGQSRSQSQGRSASLGIGNDPMGRGEQRKRSAERGALDLGYAQELLTLDADQRPRKEAFL